MKKNKTKNKPQPKFTSSPKDNCYEHVGEPSFFFFTSKCLFLKKKKINYYERRVIQSKS